MKKSVKIILLIAIPILLGVAAFGGTVLYTYLQVDHFIGDTNVTFDITPDFVEGYIGFITLTTPAQISNKGVYSLREVNITIVVEGENFTLSTLNTELLAKGENLLGDINAGDVWSDDLVVQLTYYIPLLAVDDGDFVISIFISLKVDFAIFKVPINIEVVEFAEWDSPFGI
jgi:hypothetical protein